MKWQDIITKDFLEEQYIKQELSMNQIAQKIGRDSTLIHHYMKKFKIPRRSYSLSNHLRMKNEFVLTAELRQYIDGLVISDATVDQLSQYSARLSQVFATDFLEWAELIQKNLASFDIRSTLHFGKRMPMLYTPYYVQFLEFRNRWYKNKKKIVPVDIELSPSMCLNWYLGDGSLNKDSFYIVLCTDGFAKEEVVLLKNKLNNLLNLQSSINSANEVRIPRRKVPDFLDYIGDPPVECFSYKWWY